MPRLVSLVRTPNIGPLTFTRLLERFGNATDALGIDGEPHAASLTNGTVAVPGGGIDHIYPPQIDQLYREIAEQGLIVSESPTGYRACAQDSPRSKRIITGMARSVARVEAAERFGSLISARMAGEQSREVMAIPGSPLDPRAANTNGLIRQGAAPVRHAQDVLKALAGFPPSCRRRRPSRGNSLMVRSA